MLILFFKYKNKYLILSLILFVCHVCIQSYLIIEYVIILSNLGFILTLAAFQNMFFKATLRIAFEIFSTFENMVLKVQTRP